MRTDCAASERAISSSRLEIRLTRSPSPGCTLNVVTVGPLIQPTTCEWRLNSCRVNWSRLSRLAKLYIRRRRGSGMGIMAKHRQRRQLALPIVILRLGISAHGLGGGHDGSCASTRRSAFTRRGRARVPAGNREWEAAFPDCRQERERPAPPRIPPFRQKGRREAHRSVRPPTQGFRSSLQGNTGSSAAEDAAEAFPATACSAGTCLSSMGIRRVLAASALSCSETSTKGSSSGSSGSSVMSVVFARSPI